MQSIFQPVENALSISIECYGFLGITDNELKKFEKIFLDISKLDNSLYCTNNDCQFLHSIIKIDSSVLKAYPIHLFNLGGTNSGLTISKTLYSNFVREFHFFTWLFTLCCVLTRISR